MGKSGAKSRVLFVLPVLAPYSIPRFSALAACGDLDVHVGLEAEHFAERPGWQAQDIPGCSVKVMPGIRYTKRFSEKKRNFSDSYSKVIPVGLISQIWKLEPDLVVGCNPTQILLARIVRLFRVFKLGLVLEDTPISEYRKSKWTQFLRKMVYRGCDVVFYFSEDALRYAESIGLSGELRKSSWSVPAIESSPSEGTGNPPREIFRFLFVGALIPRKGVMHLMRAWRVFARRNAGVSLELLGKGELRDEIEKFCVDHAIDSVTLSGHLSHEEVTRRYQAADAFVLPTVEDLFSLVVTEAMTHGLPVLTTVYNGARELVEEGKNGYVFDPLEQEQIVEALSRIYEDRDRLPQMRKHSLRVISDYTHDKVMKRMNADIVSLLGHR